MTTAKRQTITDFLKASICEGQAEIGPIGYSPLPINLVQAGFTQVAKLQQADPAVQFDASIIQNVNDCHNPTFIAGHPEQNYLAKIAPMPADCDRPGQGPCADGVGAANDNPDSSGKPPKDPVKGNGGNSGGGTGGGTPDGAGTDGPGTGTPADPSGVPDAPSAGSDPVADDLGLGAATTAADGTSNAPISVVATTLPDDGAAGTRNSLLALVIGLFLGVLVVPTLISRAVRRRAPR
jgi:hypothetical protein